MVKHILADGTELTSIEGRVIPPTGKTEAVYRLIANYIMEHQKGGRGNKGYDESKHRRTISYHAPHQ